MAGLPDDRDNEHLEFLALRKYTQMCIRDSLYIEMAGCFAYLALVTDAYSHKIVGWELAPSLRACNALAALKMALNLSLIHILLPFVVPLTSTDAPIMLSPLASLTTP